MFKHKNQKQFYADYAIKNGQVGDERTLNLYGRKLKKEIDDTYNLIAIFAGLEPIAYNANTEYETGEIVFYEKQAYIAVKDSKSQPPTISKNNTKVLNEEYWQLFTDFAHLANLTTLDNFLPKNNQEPYDPSILQEGENTIVYHPATVKYVEQSLQEMLDKGVITNADRLDGYHATDFVSQQQFKELNDSLKDLDITAFVPVSIDIDKTWGEITSTPVGEYINLVPYAMFQQFFNIVNLRDHYNYRFNGNTILSAQISETEYQQILSVCICGPFKGFGCREDEYTNGQLVLTLTMNKETKDYDDVYIESNCMKMISQEELNDIPNKSSYVNYIIVEKKYDWVIRGSNPHDLVVSIAIPKDGTYYLRAKKSDNGGDSDISYIQNTTTLFEDTLTENWTEHITPLSKGILKLELGNVQFEISNNSSYSGTIKDHKQYSVYVNGSGSVSANFGYPGDKITIAVTGTPTVTVLNEFNNSIEVTKESDTVYSFVMPYSNVTVKIS